MNRRASPIRVGSRASRLAQIQSKLVKEALQRTLPDTAVELVTITTEGDRELTRALPEIGGKGLFTAEIERALLQDEIDLAVHSLKDLPTEAVEGIELAAVPRRADARDVLVTANGTDLEGLPAHAKIGTSSPRRRAQLLALRPDLNVEWIRGNVETRIEKMRTGEFDAVVLAAAGLVRLGLHDQVSQWFSPDEIMPAPAQAALAVQCRADDQITLERVRPIDDAETRAAVSAERAFLQTLESGCSAPVGALAEAAADGVEMRGLVASAHAAASIRVSGHGRDPVELGRRLGREALQAGARDLVNRDE